jgi:hypothetical protein
MGQGTLSFSKNPDPFETFDWRSEMKIKSLLLGSAAALTVVSGAQAADAIMAAAPEPVEYVRVCDAFGTGYFYIPGTETCLKIGGYVRQDIKGGELLGKDMNGDGDGDALATSGRFSFTTDTRSDTELGVLATHTELRFNWGENPGAAEIYNFDTSALDVNRAYITLGGFSVGKRDSMFTNLSFYGHGYAGGVINDTLVGYGPFGTTFISYTYKGTGGFAAGIALEDDGGQSSDRFNNGVFNAAADGDYIPDVVGGVSYDGGAFGAALIGAYDSSMEEGAIKLRADATFGRVKGFLMGAWSSNGNETGVYSPFGGSVTSGGSNHFATWGGDWAIFGGLSADLTPKIGSNLQLSYDDDENFGAAANLVFHVVPGFDITTEIDYADAGGVNSVAQPFRYNTDVDKQWGGMVRFQRSF